MTKRTLTLALTATLTAGLGAAALADGNSENGKARTQAEKVARGAYIVKTSACHDCHTPLKMGPKGPERDLSRMLSGHPS
jgi:mono/diheme cytochrome c family protein